MPETKNRIDQIIDDLKSSWYFRLFAVLWLISFIMFWVSIGVFGERSQTGSKEPAWRLWFENDTKSGIEYPPFHFRLPRHERNVTIDYASCQWSAITLVKQACADGEPMTRCISFETSGFGASPAEDWLRCTINTTATADWREDRLIEFDTNHNINRTRPGSSLFIGPNRFALVTLHKTMVRRSSGKDFPLWQKQLQYHSSVWTNHTFHVVLSFASFETIHLEQYDFYTGWMGVADIGGFMFFMTILVAIGMVAVGCVFSNDSKFLSNSHKYDQTL
jgi:uncharacterized membrane protein